MARPVFHSRIEVNLDNQIGTMPACQKLVSELLAISVGVLVFFVFISSHPAEVLFFFGRVSARNDGDDPFAAYCESSYRNQRYIIVVTRVARGYIQTSERTRHRSTRPKSTRHKLPLLLRPLKEGKEMKAPQ